MYHLLENVFISREFYQTMLAPLCEKYRMTQTEMIVLLFLANNPQLDTASDIVEKRCITKSAVSAAARALQERGAITGEYTNGNHRSIHLKIQNDAQSIISEGKKAQSRFFNVLTRGFSEDEQRTLKNYITRITENIRNYNHSAE